MPKKLTKIPKNAKLGSKFLTVVVSKKEMLHIPLTKMKGGTKKIK